MIKQKLLGVLELSLFMKRGIDWFENDRAAMWRSFIWPVVVFPVTMIGVFLAQRPEIQGLSAFQVISLYIIRDIVAIILVYQFFAKGSAYLGRGETFPRFMTASNWLCINSAVMSVPTIISLGFGQDWISTYGILILLGLYGHAVFGYTAMRAFKFPWELGAASAVVSLAISETTLKMLFDAAAWIRG
jgi:hypothetical protein